jgi:hypothetical protein
MYVLKNGQKTPVKTKENWTKPMASAPSKKEDKEKKYGKLVLLVLVVILVVLAGYYLYKRRESGGSGPVAAAFGRKFGFRFY